MAKTIKTNETALTEIKKSKFFSYAFYCETLEDVKNFLDSLKLEHKKATHICFAYVVNGSVKASDNGEPQGTAGVPILDVIRKQNLENVLICVVRYFGGIKLGAGGLIRAYGESAKSVIEKCEICNLINATHYTLKLEYTQESVLNDLKKLANIFYLDVKYNQKIDVSFYATELIDLKNFEKYNLTKQENLLIRN